ncbi:hypothetical protein [Nocardioides sp. W7]|uniref:hypothetical protein n=1 Tax=Nocardioides sp. W7 TaxID=2931390 RepID=UPI001FD38261|nr:hypothetical protein [Nocardioides sp. W7]
MSPSRSRRWLAVPLLLTLATAGLGSVVPSASAAAATGDASGVVRLDASRAGTPGRAPATMRTARKKQSDRRVQQVTVSWKGTKKRRVYSKSAVIPGIGRLSMTCRPNATYLRLRVEDRSAETQFWMAKYETKDNRAVVATKTARVYQYADAADDGTGGTGATSSEGLNQRGRIENFSSGYLDGVISQRPGRNQPVTGSAPRPVTSVKLNWWWTGFRHPMSWRSCKIDAVFTTRYAPRMGVSWHGDADAATTQHAEYDLPQLGTLQLRCEPDTGSREGRRTIALAPAMRNRSARVWVETVTGEGRVEQHVDGESIGYDPETGLVGSIDLPRNGMLRLFFEVGKVKRSFIVSSYLLTNNRARPELNVCETAVAAY